MTEIYLNEHDKSVLVDIGWKLDRLNDHLEKLIPELVKLNTPVTMLNQDGTTDPRGITEKYGHRKAPRLPCSNCGGTGIIRPSPKAFQLQGLAERCKDCDATGFIGDKCKRCGGRKVLQVWCDGDLVSECKCPDCG